jgi:hypothetical protein
MKSCMRYIVFILALVLVACKSKDVTSVLGKPKKLSFTADILDMKNATVTLWKNTKIDTLLTNASGFYPLKYDASTDVIRYVYAINMDQAAYDGGYSEELLFEIPHQDATFTLTDSALQQTKMLFGRHCHCRGQNGFFSVVKGTLRFVKKDKQLSFSLNFKVNKVPQKVNKIEHNAN